MFNIHHKAITKIYLVAGLSIILLTSSFYLFGFKPLSDRLHIEHSFEIDHLLDSSQWLVEGVLNKHIDLAQQTASRSAIRNRQADYLSGKVTLDELITFSTPKLSDALQANNEIVGIARYDTAGTLLFNVGKTIPEVTASQCNFPRLNAIKLLNPTQINKQRYLLYCSPIDDQKRGRVGYDILTLKEDAIQKIIDSPQSTDTNRMTIGITSADKIIYWPTTPDVAKSYDILQSFIHSSITEDGYIIQSRLLPYNDWKLYTVVNKNIFFADIQKQLYVLIAVIFSVAMVLLVLTVAALRPVINTLLQEQHLFELSHSDGLTGLFNHRYMQELLDIELSRAQRHQRMFSILMFDIDHFKKINDQYGHLAGDKVLKTVANITQSMMRKQDLSARYGGEEFMIILPDTDENGATTLAERLRKNIQNEIFTIEYTDFHISISIGVACYLPAKEPMQKHNLIQAADRALYTSKDNGRNQTTTVVVNPEIIAEHP